MSAERVPRTPPIESKALLASDISREVDVPGGVDKVSWDIPQAFSGYFTT